MGSELKTRHRKIYQNKYKKWGGVSNFFNCPVILKDNSLLIGCVRLSHFMNKRVDIGCWIRTDLQGQGLATEATQGLIKFAFFKLGLNKIYATVDPENFPAIRVLEKSGLKKEGHLKEDILIRGNYRDSILMSILKRTFLSN